MAPSDSHEANDLDMLVEFEGPGRFTQFLELKRLLEDACGVPVDLVTRAAIASMPNEQELSAAMRLA